MYGGAYGITFRTEPKLEAALALVSHRVVVKRLQKVLNRVMCWKGSRADMMFMRRISWGYRFILGRPIIFILTCIACIQFCLYVLVAFYLAVP